MTSGTDRPDWASCVEHEVAIEQLVALWGKSDAGGAPLPLVQHLFDAMAVAELIWDRFLAPGLQYRFDEAMGGRGRSTYAWLCGLHDVGKATPAFQSKAEDLWAVVRAAGLSTPNVPVGAGRNWRHEKASGRILFDLLRERWSSNEAVGWIWPLVAGHHGLFHETASLQAGNCSGHNRPKAILIHGDDGWQRVQVALVEIITRAAGFSKLEDVQPSGALTRADQLALSGFIVMADWIASMEHSFPWVSVEGVGPDVARTRAGNAWEALGFKRGWGRLPEPRGDPTRRFQGLTKLRPVQRVVIKAAGELSTPGLMIVEAPTGEGKTEAALAAAEVLAARFGADGIFVGLPTQATSDPMFDRVADWLKTFDERLPISLLHGRRLFHDRWRLLTRQNQDTTASDDDRDVYGMVDPFVFGGVCEDDHDEAEELLDLVVIDWMLGRHRGLLSPNVVGTIDQLLFAGTRTRYVMLRYAGLAGKVVILDEVHAVDVFMAEYLTEVLAWLGQGRVPVVLLSATLAPEQRQSLVDAYVHGALGGGHQEQTALPTVETTPTVLTACVDDGEPVVAMETTTSSRATQVYDVELLAEDEGEGDESAAERVADLIGRELAEGGCALVIRNTVARAQATFRAVQHAVEGEVVLVHSRLSAGDRADRTRRLLSRLGPDAEHRPRWEEGARLVVVATQVAEQSFDVDVDLLVTDHAPVDLLVQRAGRMHRHRRPDRVRPPGLRRPRLVVTGAALRGEDPPWFPGGSEAVYGRYLLLRSWATVERAFEQGWTMPGDVPALVADVYGEAEILPDTWKVDAAAARAKWEGENRESMADANRFVLTESGSSSKRTLDGLNVTGPDTRDVEERVRVRDGDPSMEVVLVQEGAGGLWTLDHRTSLGLNGEAVRRGMADEDDMVLAVLAGTVRVPTNRGRDAALADLGALPEWRDHPWLKHQKVLRLDAGRRAALSAGWSLEYDDELGVLMERPR